MSRIHDRDIVRAILDGDRKAADAFVRAWLGTVLGFCHHHCRGGADDAQDLCQEVFIRLLERDAARLRTWDGRAGMKTWLATVTRNLFLDRLRAQERRAAEPLAAGHEQVDDAVPLDDAAFSEERGRALRAALLRLSARDRALLEMVYFEELAASEAGERLGMRAVAVRVALLRARERLARHLRPAGLEGGAHGSTPA